MRASERQIEICAAHVSSDGVNDWMMGSWWNDGMMESGSVCPGENGWS